VLPEKYYCFSGKCFCGLIVTLLHMYINSGSFYKSLYGHTVVTRGFMPGGFQPLMSFKEKSLVPEYKCLSAAVAETIFLDFREGLFITVQAISYVAPVGWSQITGK
jgi:hypothetical protein